MKRIILITLITAALTGCATQQPAPQTVAQQQDPQAAMLVDYAKCQRLGYLAATEGDKDEIGALKFDIKTRVRAKTITVSREQCAEAIARGKEEGFQARHDAELALTKATKQGK